MSPPSLVETSHQRAECLPLLQICTTPPEKSFETQEDNRQIEYGPARIAPVWNSEADWILP